MVNNDTIQQLDALSFQSLTQKGIDWRHIVASNPVLNKKYQDYLNLKKDYIMVNCDYSQLEVYVLAALSRDPTLVKAINAGLDIHSFNCEKVFGLNLKQLEKDMSEAKTPQEIATAKAGLEYFDAKRKTVKALTFSLSYGAGKEKIAMDLRITVIEAEKLINDFYNAYPRLRAWQGETLLKAIKLGYLETPMGRRRVTATIHGRHEAYNAFIKEDKSTISTLKKDGEYWSLRNDFKTVLNTNVQSYASDMMSIAACKFKEWLKTAGKRAEMLFWVHDSCVFSVHIDDAIEVIEACRDFMETKAKFGDDPINYRTSIDVGYTYEFMSPIKRDAWIVSTDKLSMLNERLYESLDLDTHKKLKLVVKSSSLEMNKEYTKNIMKTKEEYFEKLIQKLGIEGINTPLDYMAYQNNMSVEEYEEAMQITDSLDAVNDD